jgi:hypothetical protein
MSVGSFVSHDWADAEFKKRWNEKVAVRRAMKKLLEDGPLAIATVVSVLTERGFDAPPEAIRTTLDEGFLELTRLLNLRLGDQSQQE